MEIKKILKFNEILEFIKKNTSNLYRKYEKKDNIIYIYHISKGRFKYFLYGILIVIFSLFTYIVIKTQYSYIDLIFNIYFASLIFILGIIFLLMYDYMESIFIQIDLKEEQIMIGHFTFKYSDIEKIYYKASWAGGGKTGPIRIIGYNIFIKMSNGVSENIIDIYKEGDAKVLCEKLLEFFNKSKRNFGK